MSEYVRKTYGPGDIAALGPTIGATSRAPTIGAEDVGRPIKQAFPFTPQHGGAPVEQAGVLAMGSNAMTRVYQAALYGMGNFGQNLPSWAMPVGIGAVIGVVGYMLWKSKKRDEFGGRVARGSIFENRSYEIERKGGKVSVRIPKRRRLESNCCD